MYNFRLAQRGESRGSLKFQLLTVRVYLSKPRVSEQAMAISRSIFKGGGYRRISFRTWKLCDSTVLVTFDWLKIELVMERNGLVHHASVGGLVTIRDQR